jgi:hypothetical protein
MVSGRGGERPCVQVRADYTLNLNPYPQHPELIASADETVRCERTDCNADHGCEEDVDGDCLETPTAMLCFEHTIHAIDVM